MKHLLILVALINLCTIAHAQSTNDKIDQLFNDLNIGTKPGCVLSIQKKGKTIYSNSFGLQNMQNDVKISDSTLFNIGSVSKQFTAAGIVLLHNRGHLTFDDPIKKFLPELSSPLDNITIRQLLHHTSGIRSTPEFFGLAGWNEDQIITTADDYQFLCRQTATNFTPGSQFMYSNSGYVLLAKIIERVSQTPFERWMKENIFTPLNMQDTYVDISNANSADAIAQPYIQTGPSDYITPNNPSHDIGASNIYSNIIDLNKWVKNFEKPMHGWSEVFETLQSTQPLTNGYRNNYAFGIILDEDHGNPRIQHSGAVPGYLSYIFYYPKEKLSVILLSNLLSREIDEKVNSIPSLFLKNRTTSNHSKPKPSKWLPYYKQDAKDFLGDYWNINHNYSRKIDLKNDTLFYVRDNGTQSPLVKIERNKYYLDGIRVLVTVEFDTTNNSMIVQDGTSAPEYFEQYDNVPPTISDLNSYTGTYFSEELQTTYQIELIDDKLVGSHQKFGQFEINVIHKDFTDWSGFATAKYHRNSSNKVCGFYVSLNRVKNVWFEKQLN